MKIISKILIGIAFVIGTGVATAQQPIPSKIPLTESQKPMYIAVYNGWNGLTADFTTNDEYYKDEVGDKLEKKLTGVISNLSKGTLFNLMYRSGYELVTFTYDDDDIYIVFKKRR